MGGPGTASVVLITRPHAWNPNELVSLCCSSLGVGRRRKERAVPGKGASA
jgi:hypothetical protein